MRVKPRRFSACSTVALLAVIATVAITLAACGGSSSSSSSGPAATTSTDQASASQSSTSSTSASASSTTTGSQTSSGPPVCRAAGLTLSFLGQQGATGHGELGFAVHNKLGAACNTVGYPGVEFLSRSGDPLPTKPEHTTNDFFGHSPLGEVILEPGATASFRLGVTHGSASGAGCTTAYGLQIFPPNDTATLRVTIPEGAAECGTATVSPMRGGVGAYP